MGVRRIIKSGANTLGLGIVRLKEGGVFTRGFEIRCAPIPGPEHRLFEALVNVRERTSNAMPFLRYCVSNMGNSHAQSFQDLLVLFLLEEKRDGYFVEFGASGGIKSSNTFLLENGYGWHGIVAEPARCWHQELTRNRTCLVDHRCVWSESGEMLQFNEATDAWYSAVDGLPGLDLHAKKRQGKRYAVETISLRDLLRSHDAPVSIDYLSIDTEGSEFAILDSFFPSHHDIRIITVEHNYTNQRSRIHTLLTSHGYKRLFEELSMWEDWYIKQ
jgi:FkbM family methyltransferase